MRTGITLFCLTCKEENYRTKKNKTKHPDRVEFNKYCFRCNTKTTHKEKK